MTNDPAFIYAKLNPGYDKWEERVEKSYDLVDLREEYRRFMYSPEAVKMIEDFRMEQN